MSNILENKKAFERAYESYSEAIFRYCFFRVSNRERAKELMQETFMKTWMSIAEGNDIQNIRAFLYKVATNLTINEITRRKKHESLDEMKDEHGFDAPENTDVAQASEARFIIEKLKNTGDEASELLIMRFIEDMSIEEIAEILGVSKNTVSVRLHRAIEKIREIYKNE